MRWRDLPASKNIEVRPDTRPSALAEGMIHVGVNDPSKDSLDRVYYDALRANQIHDNPLTPQQQSYLDRNFPQNLPLGPLADPSAASDPSLLARQKAQAQPFSWLSTLNPYSGINPFPHTPPWSTTINSVPGNPYPETGGAY